MRALQIAGVDFIKVHAATGREAYFAIADECRRVSIPLVGHIPRAIQPEEASAAGQWTIEHLSSLFDGKAESQVESDRQAAAFARFREEKAGTLFAKFAKDGVTFTPTLSIFEAATKVLELPRDPRQQYVSNSSRKIMDELMKRPDYQELYSPVVIQRNKEQFREMLPLAGMMQKAGVRLLAGTDLASTITFPGFDLHRELQLLVEAGLTPMQALQAATRNPAQVLKQNDLGAIQPGKIADMVLLEANPLDDIRNTQKIRAVIFNGRFRDRTALDNLLAVGAQQAAAA